MSADKSQFKDDFGKILATALAKQTTPVPDDFADNVLKKIQAAEQQNILSKIILQERLALAACIVLPLSVLVFILTFPEFVIKFSQQMVQICSTAVDTAMNTQFQWQSLIALAVAVAFAIYTFFDLLFADS